MGFIAYLNTEDMKGGVQHYEIKSPTYYATFEEKLCRTALAVIDVDTNLQPRGVKRLNSSYDPRFYFII